jgi:hypothetical protein
VEIKVKKLCALPRVIADYLKEINILSIYHVEYQLLAKKGQLACAIKGEF